MQLFGLHKCIYKLNKLILPEEKIDPIVLTIKRQVENWDKLKKSKVLDRDIAEVVGISRASYYRYRKAISVLGIRGLERKSKRPKRFRGSKIAMATVDAILAIRQENPTYGKSKITVILKRDYEIVISESSVGRILTKLRRDGKITKSISCPSSKRRRKFSGHAKRWRYGMKATSMGELVQIDHMSLSKHNIAMKEFRAWDPITKMVVADVTSNATGSAAAKFLRKVIAEYPFKVKSIQVDGGSEFMKDFEQECEKLDIKLFVLPPSRPQYNGGVERANRIFREEFYARKDIQAESIAAFKNELEKAVHKYNNYRPHFNLHGLTPMLYTKQLLEA